MKIAINFDCVQNLLSISMLVGIHFTLILVKLLTKPFLSKIEKYSFLAEIGIERILTKTEIDCFLRQNQIWLIKLHSA